MKTRYFTVLYRGELFGLFQSNHELAINFQITQLMKNPNMVIKEVKESQYKKAQEVAKDKRI